MLVGTEIPQEETHPVAEMARTILEGYASRVVADLNAHARARRLHVNSESAQLPCLQRVSTFG